MKLAASYLPLVNALIQAVAPLAPDCCPVAFCALLFARTGGGVA
jgi:hypothetical protein